MPKIITRDQIVATIKTHWGFWKVPNPLVWKYDPKKRKMYFLTCRCTRGFWIHWRKLQQGESMGCRSCRRKTHGLRYDPLYLSWHGLKKKRKPFVPEWENFQTFERWARPYYEKGWKLIRVNATLPYGPDNCDYVPIRRKKLQWVAAGDTALPIGLVHTEVENVA